VATGDFNGDGIPDLVFGRRELGSSGMPANPIYLNLGSGLFQSIGALGASPTADVIAVDITLDGLIDIIAINETGAHQVYVGTGTGSFNLHPEQFSSEAAVRGALGSFSSDGRMDLAVVGLNGGDLFFNDGLGNLGPGDLALPVIQIVGNATVSLIVEDPYTDAGATATDAIDGDLTLQILVDNQVDTAVLGTHTVTYNVTDSSGNNAVAVTRTVSVQARTGTGGGGGGSLGGELLALLALLAYLIRRRDLSGFRSKP
jgi:hypothetical protein